MILTCPDCATSYFVDDARIPPEGRTVKCSSCGARWRALREPDTETGDAQAADVEAEVVEDATAAEPPPHLPAEDVEIIAEPAPRARISAPPRRRAAAGGAFVWVGMAAVVALTIGAALVFREEVVRLWPASSEAYARVGLPVDQLGLAIEDVKLKPAFQAGRPVLSVTGSIRNTRQQTATAPTLRISLLDRDGKPLTAKLARPLNPEIPGGAKRYFAVAIADPPAGSESLAVDFEAAAAPAAEPLEAVLGPTPAEARTTGDHG